MRDDTRRAAGVRKGRGREFGREDAREGKARRGTPTFPPSSRALSHFSSAQNPLERKLRRLPSERLREGL